MSSQLDAVMLSENRVRAQDNFGDSSTAAPNCNKNGALSRASLKGPAVTLAG